MSNVFCTMQVFRRMQYLVIFSYWFLVKPLVLLALRPWYVLLRNALILLGLWKLVEYGRIKYSRYYSKEHGRRILCIVPSRTATNVTHQFRLASNASDALQCPYLPLNKHTIYTCAIAGNCSLTFPTLLWFVRKSCHICWWVNGRWWHQESMRKPSSEKASVQPLYQQPW